VTQPPIQPTSLDLYGHDVFSHHLGLHLKAQALPTHRAMGELLGGYMTHSEYVFDMSFVHGLLWLGFPSSRINLHLIVTT
jgi:hypothetical protein